MKKIIAGIAGFLILTVVLAYFSYIQVEDGTVVVLKRFGVYSERVLDPGPNFKIPILDSAYVLTTKLQKIEYSDKSLGKTNTELEFFGPKLTANDNRSLKVDVDVTVQFYINKAKAFLIFREYKVAYFERLDPVFREEIRNVFSLYKAENISDKRSDIRDTVNRVLKEKFADTAFIISSVQIRKFTLPESVTKNIEKVQKASQEKQQLVIDQEKELLKLEIEKTRLKSITVKKDQQTQGLKMLERVDPSILTFQLIETALSKWDGKLPKVLVTGGDSEGESPLSSLMGALVVDKVIADETEESVPEAVPLTSESPGEVVSEVIVLSSPPEIVSTSVLKEGLTE
jgi:regulator of protease activity HflC (stomatin/prohibitin superfamily)